ncbi:hypothetical protein [Ureibacillus manganicus]|uniref:Nucleoside-diphosphate sugar epimerase n=1 Tax=Ureibacillus manganicus DSM 26584 TaxID=1384049 RepID=A0A0A3I219_9BACL|nr:hypothetical protein [Ureibacillus manganicus]KGR78754.1 hypothetical protein CD29_10305 [Ureibacillus manganicus DSM 26584]
MLRLSWLISLGISLLGTLIVGNLYIQSDDNAKSFGFIGMVLLIPFLLLSLFITFRFFLVASRNADDRLMRLFSFVVGVVLIGVLIYFIIDYKNDALSDIGLPMLDQQTYSIYFNFYTFALIHSISGFVGGLVGLGKKESQVEG